MAETELTPEEKAAIQKDIDDANKTLVSDDTRVAIEKAKVEAKAEAAKEFEVNAKIKELEAEKEKLKQDQIIKEKEAAEKLVELTNKVNEMTTSRAAINTQDPFKSNTTPSDMKSRVENLTEEDAKDIENEASRQFWGDEGFEIIERERLAQQ